MNTASPIATLLKRSADGILYNDHHWANGVGPLLFRHACPMGLEGVVSERQDSTYKAGPSKHWIKVKNPKSSAMTRVKVFGPGDW